MEERYEIRGKIGQGGLGAVYRGYDTRMNREIAIKRISVANDDPDLQEESTRQLIKEAGALASLQHPHIVTVYDVGSDEDGPYVIMELINGKTLDELIERAPLTWNDFRELAIQTQEALIAAQELDLIHSDIKPSNLMLTWLPSGKFQMKIVDFGLATLTQSQSLEELQEIEAVFGSIFFMAPEQFERVPIDARTDMYAMGCVYYQALTGLYPFKGETGNEVMVSHLHHTVVPIQEVRADIPLWACDWIMWHINRMPGDRPESAREALHVFFQNDKNPSPTMSLGRAQPAAPAGPRPRLSIPGAPNPAAPRRPITDPRMAPPGYVAAAPEPEPEPIPEPPLTTTAPQPLLPPEGFKPSIYEAKEMPDASAVATVPLKTAAYVPPSRAYIPPPRKKNTGMIIAITVFVTIAAVAIGLLVKMRMGQGEGGDRFQTLLLEAGKPEVNEIPISSNELTEYLGAAADADTEVTRAKTYQLLSKAKATDGTDFNSVITKFTTTSTRILPEVREGLIASVLAKRMDPAMVPDLTEFIRSTNDSRSAVAALRAIEPAAGDDQFEAFFSVLQFHKNAEIRKGAESVLLEILKRTKKRAQFSAEINNVSNGTSDPTLRDALRRLSTAAGN